MVQRFRELRYTLTLHVCHAHACACGEVDAPRTYIHMYTGEGDRPTEIKSTSGRARGETKVRVSVAAGKERRTGEPAGESHLSAHVSSYPFPPFCLSLALSIPLALTRESHRHLPLSLSLSLPAAPRYLFFPLAPYLSLTLSFCGLLPVPGVHYLSFFLYFLCPPLVQMARTISGRVVPYGILLRVTSVPFDRDKREAFKIFARLPHSR